MSLQRGYVLLWHEPRYGTNWLVKLTGWLINLFQKKPKKTKEDYVHAAICIDPAQLLIVEAILPKVYEDYLTIQDFTEQRIDYFEVNGTIPADIEKACKLAWSFRGKSYDLWGLLGLFYTSRTASLYCTRLVCECYTQLWNKFSGYKLISPDDLFASGLLTYKGCLSHDQLPDYWPDTTSPA